MGIFGKELGERCSTDGEGNLVCEYHDNDSEIPTIEGSVVIATNPDNCTPIIRGFEARTDRANKKIQERIKAQVVSCKQGLN